MRDLLLTMFPNYMTEPKKPEADTKAIATDMPPELEKLTAKQRAFVIAYVKTNNGVQSAKVAKYKGNPDQLKVIASQNLTKINVKNAITALTKPALDESNITVERIVKEFESIAFADWKEFMVVKNSKGKVTVAKILLKDKITALSKLGEYKGMFQGSKTDDAMKPSLNFHFHPGWSPDEARRALLEFLRTQ